MRPMPGKGDGMSMGCLCWGLGPYIKAGSPTSGRAINWHRGRPGTPADAIGINLPQKEMTKACSTWNYSKKWVRLSKRVPRSFL